MEQYAEACSLLATGDGIVSYGRQSERWVALAEALLGVRFPPTYRRFVLEFGGLSVPGIEISGVVGDPRLERDATSVVWYTQDMRSKDDLPGHLIAIANDDEATLVLDCSRSGEGPLLRFFVGLPQAEQPWEVQAPDFGSFLLWVARWATRPRDS